MFRGTTQIRLPLSIEPSRVADTVADALTTLGVASVSKSGAIEIVVDERLRTVFSKASADGRIRRRSNHYLVELDFDSTLTVWGWIVLVVFFIYLLGLLVFLSPYSTRNNIARAAKEAMHDIEDQLLPEGQSFLG